jgi:hypothetical protein
VLAFGEGIDLRKALGLLLAFAGLVLLTGGPSDAGSNGDEPREAGQAR